MDLRQQILDFGKRARGASRTLARLEAEGKSDILHSMADEILARGAEIFDANQRDLQGAKDSGLAGAMLERLTLNPARLDAMADGIRRVAKLPDPVGQILREWTQPNGIRISKIRVPIGVIGIIYESRPNVTSDAAVLCVKTGNAVILRGGSEAL